MNTNKISYIMPKEITNDVTFHSVFPKWFGKITYREFSWTLFYAIIIMAVILLNNTFYRNFPNNIFLGVIIFLFVSIVVRFSVRNGFIKKLTFKIRKKKNQTIFQNLT